MAWVKADPETTLRRHIVAVTRAYEAFREAPARKHSPSCQGYHFNKGRLTKQTTIGTLDLDVEREAIEYLEYDFLTNRFHVTHCGGCAVLFNKDAFFSDIKVSSIDLHDTRACEQHKIKEGESGWVLQGVDFKSRYSSATPNPPAFYTAPHRCGAQEQYQVNGPMCVWFCQSHELA